MVAFNLDINDPTDNSIGAVFPANERAFRAAISGYINTEHDINTGYHTFQELTSTQISGLTTPPNGMLVWDTTKSQLEINTGTSSSPVWTTVAGSSFWVGVKSKTANYPIVVADGGYLFNNTGASGNITLTLPDVSTINAGWWIGAITTVAHDLTIQVNGSASETILFGNAASGGESAVDLVGSSPYFSYLFIYDGGGNFEMIPSPSSATQLFTAYTITNTTTFTIPAGVNSIKATAVGGGGGGDTAGGGAGAGFIAWYNGLAPGKTITGTIGAGGTVGNDGGDTTLTSGTQTISTSTAGGGSKAVTTTPGGGGSASGSATFQVSGADGIATMGGPQGLLGTFGMGGAAGSGTGIQGCILIEWLF